MKTLAAIALLALMSSLALTSPPLREGPGEGVESSHALIQQTASQSQPAAEEVFFKTIDITIDPKGRPMGAYQFELTSKDPSFMIVGVTGTAHPAFKAKGKKHSKPLYDQVAFQNGTDRLIIAQFANPELDNNDLPTRPTVVASISVRFKKPADTNDPAIRLKLITAGNADGKPINATIDHSFRSPERPE